MHPHTYLQGEIHDGSRERLGCGCTRTVTPILKYQSDAFQRAIKHHPKIVFGPDYDPDFLPNEFAAMVEGGLTPIEALQTATTHGAELLGLSSEIGSLEQGKAADIIAVSRDPTKDIRAMKTVVFVMKAGRVLRDSRATEK